MLILAFDTATDVATSALVADGEVLGERVSRAVTLLEDIDALLRRASAHTADLEGLAVGIGPGSFTGIRIGLATARGLALGLDLRVAGVSTLDALAAGAPGAFPVVDARRREVFSLHDDVPVVGAPEFVTGQSSRRREPRFRPIPTSAICRGPAFTRSWPASSDRPRRWSRSTCGYPTLIKRANERDCEPGRFSSPRAS
jgi:glycoprotease family protein